MTMIADKLLSISLSKDYDLLEINVYIIPTAGPKEQGISPGIRANLRGGGLHGGVEGVPMQFENAP